MMTKTDWREAILATPVFDTHTHLNMPGVPIPAQTFWDIAHYFWFNEELWSVGYPHDAKSLPEDERIAAFVRAFAAIRNTAWSKIVRHIFANLYDVDLPAEDSNRAMDAVRAADAAVRANAQDPGWARSVINRLAIRNIAVNNLREADFPELPGVGVAVPGWAEQRDWAEKILTAADQHAAGQAAQAAAVQAVSALAAQGIRGLRIDADPFEGSEPTGFWGKAAIAMPADALPVNGASPAQIHAFLSHAILRALSAQTQAGPRMFAQYFIGVERDVTPHTAMGVNNPRRVIDLYPLFERYACDHELVIGAPQNNMDAAQPARIYPNVHLGGLWWYNFRSSTYRHAMQVRLEAVPAAKSALIASDARCIEWCYGKILLVKWLLADFLHDQVAGGWLTEADALWVAREWLHDAPARRYLG